MSCGVKDKCCCCDLATGIKVLGVWMIIECLMSLFAIFGRRPSMYVEDTFSFLSAFIIALCFVLVIAKPNSLMARQSWLIAILADLGVHILLAALGLYRI